MFYLTWYNFLLAYFILVTSLKIKAEVVILKPFLPLMVSNTDNLLQLNVILDLSLTYKIFAIWLVEENAILAILYSWTTTQQPSISVTGKKIKFIN